MTKFKKESWGSHQDPSGGVRPPQIFFLNYPSVISLLHVLPYFYKKVEKCWKIGGESPIDPSGGARARKIVCFQIFLILAVQHI